MDLYVILFAAMLTFYVSYASIFKSVQDWAYIFRCPLCLGFWVGALVEAVFGPSVMRLPVHFALLNLAFHGMAAGILAFILKSKAETWEKE